MPTSDLLINGVRYDHSSCDIKIDSISRFGVKSISYNDNLEPGEGYGTGGQIIFRTRGIYKANGSIELWRYEYDNVMLALAQKKPGVGSFEWVFDIEVHLLKEAQISNAVTDRLVGCRVKARDRSSSSGGSEGLSVKLDLHVMYILDNGIIPLTGLKR